MSNPIVIIGTGLAGYTLAREFRKHDTQTPLLMVTQDDGIYYSKPQLSSAHTHGKTATMLALQTPEKLAEQYHLQILTHTTVTQIDTAQQCIYMGNSTQAYSKLILALGADPITWPVSGNASASVQTVNNLLDYRKFRENIQGKQHVTIIGAGLIGCEFANDLINAGYQITVVAPSLTPLDRLLPPQLGIALQNALAAQGVTWYLQHTVQSIDHLQDRLSVNLTEGINFATDAILSAIGLKPHTTLAKSSGITVEKGICVDNYLQTNVANIYALGDCAEVASHALQYVAPLVICARALAQTLSGNPTPIHYPAMPIIIKTPAYPIVVSPPPHHRSGAWQIEETDAGMRALFHDELGQLQGFVLTKSLTNDRMALTQQLPDLIGIATHK